MALSIQRPDLGGPFPAHLAVIMDGNGRWAQKQGFKRVFGHEKGVKAVRTIVTECARMGVESLTLYAFSVENWKRPEHEIRFLMGMLERFLIDERSTLMENNVRLRGLGRLDDLPEGALRELRCTENLTASNTGMLLRLALSYGSRTELGDALQRYGAAVLAGHEDPKLANEETLRRRAWIDRALAGVRGRAGDDPARRPSCCSTASSDAPLCSALPDVALRVHT